MDLHRIKTIPLGYSVVRYRNSNYGLTRSEHNHGKSHKVFARELGGNEYISFNYYASLRTNAIKPCEMAQKKVMHFLNHFISL